MPLTKKSTPGLFFRSRCPLAPTQTAEVVKLHHLSQRLYIIREHLTGIQERHKYLCSVRRSLLDLLGDRHEPDVESAANSFNYIKTKSSTLRVEAVGSLTILSGLEYVSTCFSTCQPNRTTARTWISPSSPKKLPPQPNETVPP